MNFGRSAWSDLAFTALESVRRPDSLGRRLFIRMPNLPMKTTLLVLLALLLPAATLAAPAPAPVEGEDYVVIDGGKPFVPHAAGQVEVAAWFGEHGLDPAKMRAAMLGPAIEQRLQAARAFSLRSGVTGTPTLIVDGRYRVTGQSRDDNLRIARALVDQLAGH